MQPECVRDEGLDDVAVRAHQVDGVGAVLALHARVPLAYGLGGAGLHGPHRLAAGEGGGGRVRLHDLHQRLVRQLGELAARTSRRSGTPRSARRCARQLGPGVEQRPQGLLAALQRAGDDLGDRQPGEPPGQRGGLRGAALVEGDAGRPAGEQSRGVGGGTSVPDKDQRGHAVQRKPRPGCASGSEGSTGVPQGRLSGSTRACPRTRAL